MLAAWLNSNPNYGEVTAWYQGWKSIIPPLMLAHPGVTEPLHQVETQTHIVSLQKAFFLTER